MLNKNKKEITGKYSALDFMEVPQALGNLTFTQDLKRINKLREKEL